jgi:hypothetical protein
MMLLTMWYVPVVSVDLLQVRVILIIMRMLRLVFSLLHMVEDTASLLPPHILSGTATTLKVMI